MAWRVLRPRPFRYGLSHGGQPVKIVALRSPLQRRFVTGRALPLALAAPKFMEYRARFYHSMGKDP
jgi:hypothetical protein